MVVSNGPVSPVRFRSPPKETYEQPTASAAASQLVSR
jgi:hypothetical protein